MNRLASAIPTATSLLDTSGEDDDYECDYEEQGTEKEPINQPTTTSDSTSNPTIDNNGSSVEWCDSLQQQQQQQQQTDNHHNHQAHTTVTELEERNRILRQRLGDVQRQRRRYRQQHERCDALLQDAQWGCCHHPHPSLQQLTQELLACRQQRRVADHRLDRMQRWNVLANDAFHIDVNRGDGCATINSLRLGALGVVTTVASSAGTENMASLQQQQLQSASILSSSATVSSAVAPNTAAGSFFSFGALFPAAAPPQRPPVLLPPGASISTTIPILHKTVRVPWREINAALGQVALLLSVLEQSLAVPTTLSDTTSPIATSSSSGNSRTSSHKPALFRYEIQAMGSTSKIGVRNFSTTTSAATATSFYNLYYAEEGFQLFGRRNFNTALQYLVDCVQSAIEIVVQQRHGSIVLPHAIVVGTVGGTPTTIGGWTIQYFAVNNNNSNTQQQQQQHSSEEEHLLEWTRAMKYLLTNVKHLMVYHGLGLWNLKGC